MAGSLCFISIKLTHEQGCSSRFLADSNYTTNVNPINDLVIGVFAQRRLTHTEIICRVCLEDASQYHEKTQSPLSRTEALLNTIRPNESTIYASQSWSLMVDPGHTSS